MPSFLASAVVNDSIRFLIASESVLCRTGLGSPKSNSALLNVLERSFSKSPLPDRTAKDSGNCRGCPEHMLGQFFQLSSILASSFWFTNVLLIAFARGKRWKVLTLYVTLCLLALSLYQMSATLPGLAAPYALVGTLGSLVLIIIAAIPFWCLSRIHGMQDALTSPRKGGRRPKSTDTRENIKLIERINLTTLSFTLSILVGNLLGSAVGAYSVPVTLVVAVVLSTVFVWSEVAGHLASDETKLRIRFIAFILLVTVFSLSLSIILVSYLLLRGVVLALAAMIAAIISPVPFVYVVLLDRIKDRLFPTGTARRALALNMVALHQRAILILTAETIILSDVPAAIVSVSVGDTSAFFLWAQSFLIFVAVMIFHFTRSTYSYLAIGGLLTRRDIEEEIDRAVRRSVRFR